MASDRGYNVASTLDAANTLQGIGLASQGLHGAQTRDTQLAGVKTQTVQAPVFEQPSMNALVSHVQTITANPNFMAQEVSIPPPQNDIAISNQTPQTMRSLASTPADVQLMSGTVSNTKPMHYPPMEHIQPRHMQHPQLIQPTVVDANGIPVAPFRGGVAQAASGVLVQGVSVKPALYRSRDINRVKNSYAQTLHSYRMLQQVKELMETEITRLRQSGGSPSVIQTFQSALGEVSSALGSLKCGGFVEWLAKQGIEQILPRVNNAHLGPAKFISNPVERGKIYRSILHPVQNALAVSEEMNLMDFISFLPEYAERVFPAPQNGQPVQFFSNTPEAVASNNNYAPVLDTSENVSAPILPGSSFSQPLKKRPPMPLHHAFTKRQKTQHVPSYFKISPAPTVLQDYNPGMFTPQPMTVRIQPEPGYDSISPNYTKRRRRRSGDNTPRARFPDNTKELWGFDADDIRNALIKEHGIDPARPHKPDKRGFHWAKIAKEIANDTFLELGDYGPKLKAILRRKYPQIIGNKVKIPQNPKVEWGFDADDIKRTIEELSAKEGVAVGTPNKNISLSKVGKILGLKQSRNPKHKPFAERRDRGQLVAALLRQKYPALACKFQRTRKM